MNKQEAIERIESNALNIGDNDLVVGLNVAKHIINQINEPQKVTIPKFVADWYESLNRNEDSFRKNFPFVHAPHESTNDTSWIPEDVQIWLSDWDNSFTLSNMHQFGYTVEKEKLYTVEIPNPNAEHSRIILQRLIKNELHLNEYTSEDWKEYKMNQLTEHEIRKDFDWAWQFAKEVER